MKPVVQREGEGLVLDAMASRISIHVRTEDTAGAFSVVEMQEPPGFQAPAILHRHSDVDWYALVEDGEIAIELTASSIACRAAASSSCRAASRSAGGMSNDHDVRWLATYSPGGFGRFFLEVVDRLRTLGHPPTPSDMTAITRPVWTQYGVETVQPQTPA